MYYYGNAFEKAWLSCAVSLGYASEDFLELETEKIANLIKEAKDKKTRLHRIYRQDQNKNLVQPRCILTAEAISNLEEYLKILEKKHDWKLPEYLWNGATNDNLNDWPKALIRKANIETYGKKVHFQMFRKFLYDVLARMDETVACVVTAKAVDVSKTTYRTSLDSECERVYRESYKLFASNGDVSGKTKQEQAERITQLQATLVAVEKENHVLKTRVDILQGELGMTKDALADLLKSSIKETIQEKLSEPSKTTELGFLTIPKIPNIDAMSSDDIVKLYLRLKKGESSDTIASPDLFDSIKQKPK
jgi:hypothetical protein